MRCTVTADVIKRCPYVDEIDVGTVTMVFDGDAPELHGLASWLKAYHDVKISHEDYTRRLAHRTRATVTTIWHTAGMEVKCESTWQDQSRDAATTKRTAGAGKPRRS